MQWNILMLPLSKILYISSQQINSIHLSWVFIRQDFIWPSYCFQIEVIFVLVWILTKSHIVWRVQNRTGNPNATGIGRESGFCLKWQLNIAGPFIKYACSLLVILSPSNKCQLSSYWGNKSGTLLHLRHCLKVRNIAKCLYDKSSKYIVHQRKIGFTSYSPFLSKLFLKVNLPLF